jgi:TonB family protein
MLKSRIFFSVCLALLSAVAVSAAPKDAADPKELVSRAMQQQYLWTQSTPPLLLHGEVRIWDAKGNSAKGEYTYNWVSPSRWREHIHFVNYDRVRVGDAGGYWQKSDVDYRPEIIFNLEKVLDLKDALKIEPKQTLGKVKSRKVNGVQAECTEVKWPSVTAAEMCFDESNGTLVSIDFYTLPGRHPPAITRLEYGKFAPLAGKLVAQEVKAMQGTKMVASLDILELSETPQADAALFDPPANADHWATCNEVHDRELVVSDPPIYPSEAKEKLEQGLVIVYAVIEADGSVSHTKLIQGASPFLDALTLSSVNKWRYKPAACGQEPVRTEIAIPMDFWLGG